MNAYSFELGKVTRPEIRARVVNQILVNIDADLAAKVATALGLPAPQAGAATARPAVDASPALSLMNRVKPGIKTRRIALLAAPGSDVAALKTLRDRFAAEGAKALVIAPTLAAIGDIVPDATIAGMPSVMFDAVFVCDGRQATETLAQSGDARHFVLEAFRHLKALGALGSGRDVLVAAHLPDNADGVATGEASAVQTVVQAFIAAAGQHRVWSREALAASVPA